MNSLLNNKECFIHLRSHSSFSLSSGAIQISKLIDLAIADNQPALAITDINNMFGALEFSDTALKKGLQPIIGSQVIIKDDIGLGEVVILAKNKIGYNHLTKLISNAHLQSIPNIGPVIEFDHLKDMYHGLILLTGGIKNGYIPAQIKNNQLDNARERINGLKSIFLDNLYIELQRHKLPDETIVENNLIELALKEMIPLVATNDIYFSDPSMKHAHDVLLCIEEGKTISHPNRPSMTEDHCFKTSDEMIELLNENGEQVLDLSGSDQEYIVILDADGNWILNTAGCPDELDWTGEPNEFDVVPCEGLFPDFDDVVDPDFWCNEPNPGYNPNYGGPNPNYDPNVFCGDFLFEPNPDYFGGKPSGPYEVILRIQDNRLVFVISHEDGEKIGKMMFSVQSLRRNIRDYFIVCESYYKAIRTASPSQIEALDMGRRSIHNEGSQKLSDQLYGKIKIDNETARRIFTLICALHIRS